VIRRTSLSVLLLIPTLVRAQTPAENLHTFFRETFEEQLREQPELATSIGRHEYDDRWNDWSKQGREARRARSEKRLAELNAFSVEGLSDEDKLSVRLMKYELQQRLAAFDLEDFLLRVNQMYGLHNRVYLTVDRMPGHNEQDYEKIIARLRAVPAYVDQNIALLDEAIQKGITQPPIVVDLVHKQLEAQIAQRADQTALLAAFRKFPAGIPADRQAKLLAEGTTAYEKEFLPAWRKLLNYFDKSYAPHARAQVGLGSLSNGKGDYAILVRRYTTTSMTPVEIHELGERELARLEGEMLTIARETGFNGTLAEFDAKLRTDPAQHFRSKEEMLAYCRNIAKIIEPQLPNLFRHIPLLLYGVRAIPEDREQATATNAQAPTPDGSTPGWFNLNTYDPEKQVRYDKEALVLHEAVPGHIFQGSLARAQTSLPEFRRYYGNSAYAEGWALYCESLGGQLGLYTNPYSRYGQLASERFRAVRLVVDTGIHYYGWDRDKAVAFFKQHAPEVSLAEVDRYIAWPGQALSYKIGQLRILQLRKEAQEKLGPKFDIRDFHDVVLRDGTLPMELLEQQVHEYEASAK
jgi:uncharacterized protein (DUF885 family)